MSSSQRQVVKTIDLTPTWQSAVTIYIGCLENPDATAEGKQAARDDLMNLAKFADKKIAEAKELDIKKEAE